MAKTIFITGASRGLGRIWAEAFLKRGDNVIAAVRTPKVMNSLLDEYPSSLLTLQLDVTDKQACLQAVEKSTERFGRIDTLINNAGYGHFGAIEELTEQEVTAQFQTNVFGAIWMIQAILPLFRKQKDGHIIQLSSALGLSTLPSFGLYSASKFAVEGLGEALDQEVKGFGIHVTILEPNGFATDFAGSSLSHSKPLDVYNQVKESIGSLQGAKPEDTGVPEATVNAVLTLVDTENPPLHFILGKAALPWVKNTYAQRLKTWGDWEKVSNDAHGK
ncbi:SDR family NAD(P)-dependent oxidoreductase [Pedobacter agri]|uniref:SDR family NAD(P)-dependent oxidoreductase n=1 Tax=Pedobacter agri TaxID=454586 RepID=UPI00292DE4B4|nr:SDR family NAD(P)-dependent oxidoreductase [Pedobacter agri]